MYQSGSAGDEAERRKSPAKSGGVDITVLMKVLFRELLGLFTGPLFSLQSPSRAGDTI